MNMKMAEEAALDYASSAPRFPSRLHASAFSWAHRKQHDPKVSGDFQDRAASVARRLWETAGRVRPA